MMNPFLLLTLTLSAALAQPLAPFIDFRDGKSYSTVKIGKQVWMAENLNYAAKGSVCYEDKVEYCKKYGRLYYWETAMALPESCNWRVCESLVNDKHNGICPVGWHIPDNIDWNILIHYVEGEDGEYSKYMIDGETAGRHLKTRDGWKDYEGKSGNGEDTYGFAALPAGASTNYSRRRFVQIGELACWWTATETYNGAYFRMVDREDKAWWSDNYNKSSILCSVRCVRD